MAKKDFSKMIGKAISKAVPSNRTVKATGGAFTLTAFHMACELVEQKKAAVKLVLIASRDTLGEVGKTIMKGNRYIWKPMRIDEQRGSGTTFIGGSKDQTDIYKTYYTPRRDFTIKICPELPKNVVLLVSNKGPVSKIEITD